jgi:hypothetical protein
MSCGGAKLGEAIATRNLTTPAPARNLMRPTPTGNSTMPEPPEQSILTDHYSLQTVSVATPCLISAKLS